MASNIQALKMSADTYQSPAAARSVVTALLPIMAAVFVAFLVTGLAMPVLPLHVHEGLGLGAFVVGLVAGAQFTAALLSRFWSGSYADSRGGKRAVVPGFGVEAVRRAPAEGRGLAMGAYTAFLDLALGLANPALGLVAGGLGLSAVFLAGALVVTCSAAVAARLLNAPR